MTIPRRYCPLCSDWMSEQICPVHHVPTVAESTIEEADTTTLDEGVVIAGRYRVGRLIGQGGMGAVYESHEERMGRRVALKILTRKRLKDHVHLKRFYREARAAGSLEHPNIVHVYDFGVDDKTGFPYIAMECIDGLPLHRLLEKTGPLPERRAANLALQVAQALTEAHGKGIVHRDLKPENLMVRRLSDGSEQLKVLDFGVAKIRALGDEEFESLTAEGTPIGTPQYMSPEQARGTETDFRSDLYALGFVLYRMVTGQSAMADRDPLGTLIRQVVEPEPRLPRMLADGNPPSAALVSLYHALVAKEPGARPESTAAVVASLQSVVRDAPAPGPFGARRGGERDVSRPAVGETRTPATEDTLAATAEAQTLAPALEALEKVTPGLAPPALAPADGAEESDRASWGLILAALVLVGGGLFALVPDGPPASAPDAGVAAVRAPSERPMVKSAAAVDAAAPIERVTATPAPATARPPTPSSIRITSAPAGARVHHGDRFIGETPLDYAVARDGTPMELTFSRRGYRLVRERVVDEVVVHVVLRRPARPGRPKRDAAPDAGVLRPW